MEALKKDDRLLDVDIIDFFWEKMAETQKQLGLGSNVFSILG